jgi:RNA polymerase sigma factor for flagellar operon FliA
MTAGMVVTAMTSPLPADDPTVLARVQQELDLVELLAKQLRRQLGPSVDFDDLRSAGREGLLAAARSFDPERGVPFRRWANLRIRGAMMDGVRSQGNLPRRLWRKLRQLEAGDRFQEGANEEAGSAAPGTAEEADERLSSYLAGIATAMAMGLVAETSGPNPEDVKDKEQTAEEKVAFHQMLALAREAVERRPEQERHLLVRHYFEGVTFEEAAKELGLSKSWASRLHTRAIEGLAKELGARRR